MAQQPTEDETQVDKQTRFMNSFSLAASKKQLLVNTDTGATQQEPQKPGFVSEPNFEDDISIDVEGDSDVNRAEDLEDVKVEVESKTNTSQFS